MIFLFFIFIIYYSISQSTKEIIISNSNEIYGSGSLGYQQKLLFKKDIFSKGKNYSNIKEKFRFINLDKKTPFDSKFRDFYKMKLVDIKPTYNIRLKRKPVKVTNPFIEPPLTQEELLRKFNENQPIRQRIILFIKFLILGR